MKNTYLLIVLLFFTITSNAQKKVINTEPVSQNITKEVQVLKRKVAIARFSNETQYAKGLFYDKNNDPLGKQTVDILSTKLAASNKFILLEREDLDKILAEINLSNSSDYQKVGADYLIIGSITEFGRKNVGGVNAFSRTKTQVVQAGVSIRLVDVSTGQIIYSEESKGEAETTDKTVMGLGKRTDYDATLSDKAISAAISKLVENIISNCMDRPWKSYILSNDSNGILISGGKSQGIKIGDIYEVVIKGRTVKNPQTGMNIELPGKVSGKVKVEFTGGDSPQNEFSMVVFTEGDMDPQNLNNYYIKQIK
ncbi:CsgG/HfaB family protein [Flavobacterium sp.]|uniref:CsgG/HfaB family protein n=1 Tax=Flavobacterium sp. TaxID=239 RepID=UPI003752FAB2